MLREKMMTAARNSNTHIKMESNLSTLTDIRH